MAVGSRICFVSSVIRERLSSPQVSLALPAVAERRDALAMPCEHGCLADLMPGVCSATELGGHGERFWFLPDPRALHRRQFWKGTPD